MSADPTVTIQPPSVDQRPAPPAEMPHLYAVRCWRWFPNQRPGKWLPILYTTNDPKKLAAELIGDGCRRVQIVSIAGDGVADDLGALPIRPARAFGFDVHVEGDTLRDVVVSVHQILESIIENENYGGVSGSPSAGYSVTPRHRPGMTHERYIEELARYVDANREHRKAITPPETTPSTTPRQ